MRIAGPKPPYPNLLTTWYSVSRIDEVHFGSSGTGDWSALERADFALRRRNSRELVTGNETRV